MKLFCLISLILLISCTPENIECNSDAACLKSGCSSQLCKPKVEGRTFTTCEYLPEYECYKEQNCICINNKCQWSNEKTLNLCINQKRAQ